PRARAALRRAEGGCGGRPRYSPGDGFPHPPLGAAAFGTDDGFPPGTGDRLVRRRHDHHASLLRLRSRANPVSWRANNREDEDDENDKPRRECALWLIRRTAASASRRF